MTSALPRVFVPKPIRPEALAILADVADVEMVQSDRMLSRDETRAGLSRADYVLAIGDWGFGAEELAANPRIQGIGCAYERPQVYGIDLDAATRLGIPVTRIHTTAYVDSTAELTVAFLTALAWRIPQADRYTRCGKFRQEQSVMFTTTEIASKTLGLLGLGKVGRKVAGMVAGLGMEVLYTKRSRLSRDEEADLEVTWCPTIEDTIRASDFVSLHVDSNPQTQGLIGREQFALMKPSAYFINTARAHVTDEEALIEMLTERRIAGAALDVYLGEPPFTPIPAPDPRLFDLDNVILAPHMGGHTERALIELASNAAESIAAMIRGERPPGVVNPEAYAHERHDAAKIGVIR